MLGDDRLLVVEFFYVVEHPAEGSIEHSSAVVLKSVSLKFSNWSLSAESAASAALVSIKVRKQLNESKVFCVWQVNYETF